MTSLTIIAIVGHFIFTYLIGLQARQEGKYHPYLLKAKKLRLNKVKHHFIGNRVKI